MLCRILAASLAAGVGMLIAGVGNVYTGVELPLFVKIDNVPEEVVSSTTFTRSVKWFRSRGVRCHAWLYVPQTADREAREALPPVVIMAHGMGAQKDMGLAAYAEEFAKRGIASLVFDYRTFGGSDGMPRNNVDPWRHIEDYQAALDYVRGPDLVSEVDSKRIALWGTSFAGGHVLKVAASDRATEHVGRIRAVISQVPHLDGRAASKRAVQDRGTKGTLKMAAATIGDAIRGILGMNARYVAIVKCEGDDTVALMSLKGDDCSSYFQKHPSVYLGGWRNQACARVGAMVGLYSPVKAISEVKAPLFLIAAEKDYLCPADAVRAAAATAVNARVSIYDESHFGIYLGDTQQAIVRDMSNFLEEHLGH